MKLSRLYQNCKSRTRNKDIILPKRKKAVSDKNSYYRAVKIFKKLDNVLKLLDIEKKSVKLKLKKWMNKNVF